MNRETLEFDVVIVGGGPAGLSASIRLMQLAAEKQTTLNVCVIDKGANIGAHILSGAVLEPRALDELLPNWQNSDFPMHTAVTEDVFQLLTKNKAYRLPTPAPMHNHGNYIISLGQFCRYLANMAENLGVSIFPGFAATEIVYDNDRVVGIITGDKGVDTRGQPKANFQPGVCLMAKQVVFAEGCRGSLTESLITRFDLRAGSDPQTYGLGIKELWEIPKEAHQPGLVQHSIGWPLDNKTYGGSFCYHFGENLLSIGFVVGLDYQNPYLNPYEEFQRFKSHPSMAPLLAKSRRIAYGARTLIEGGIQSLPTLVVPGAVIVGDAAGFLNVPKIKGIHTAMKSGMLAAESLFTQLQTTQVKCDAYPAAVKNSWLYDELYRVRNIRPAMRHGLWLGLTYAAIDTYIFRGRAPWTLHHHQQDRQALKKAADCQPIDYPKHDNVVTFDLSQSLYLANIAYDENQPYHLKIKSRPTAIDVNFKQYAFPEGRYCPAGVYDIAYNEANEPRLLIHGGNCIQCKACDIKDPTQNILWTPSEGGSGPQYEMM